VYSLKFYILWLLITKLLPIKVCSVRTLLSFYMKITALDMKTNISLIINDEQKLRKRTDSILPSILIVIVSAVYNKQ